MTPSELIARLSEKVPLVDWTITPSQVYSDTYELRAKIEVKGTELYTMVYTHPSDIDDLLLKSLAFNAVHRLVGVLLNTSPKENFVR